MIEEARQTSPSRIIMLGLVVVLCLSGRPLTFSIAGIHSSVLELVAIFAFLIIVPGRQALRSPLWPLYVVLLGTAIAPAIVGAYKNDLAQVLRDYAQLVYISFIFVGTIYFSRHIFETNTLLVVACWSAGIYCSFFLIDDNIIKSGIVTPLQFQWRIVVAFAFICLVARIFSVPGSPRIGLPSAIGILSVLFLYSIDVPTRAFLIMIASGVLVMLIGFIIKQGNVDGARIWTVTLIAICAAITITSSSLLISSTVGGANVQLPEGGSLQRLILLGNQDLDVTARFRLDAWDQATPGGLESWVFGHGFGTYIYLDPWIRGNFEWFPAAMIHNTFIQILYNGGILHLSGYLLLFFHIFRQTGARGDKQSDLERAGVTLILRSFVVGFLVYAAFSTTLFDPISAIQFWFLVGFLSGVTKTPAFRRPQYLGPSREPPCPPRTPNNEAHRLDAGSEPLST